MQVILYDKIQRPFPFGDRYRTRGVRVYPAGDKCNSDDCHCWASCSVSRVRRCIDAGAPQSGDGKSHLGMVRNNHGAVPLIR